MKYLIPDNVNELKQLLYEGAKAMELTARRWETNYGITDWGVVLKRNKRDSFLAAIGILENADD